jgi:hypothetical protein
MRDDFIIVPVAVVLFFLLLLLYVGGSKTENTRIYENCLTNNSTMTYNDVTKMCKEFVK